MSYTINCDMGEGFGRYRLADDASLMPFADLVNLACGFHAADPRIMSDTVAQASRFNVRVGAHPSLPDLQGFGRREMKLARDEISSLIRYQVGALKAFLDFHSLALSHVKPHGALYGMAGRDAEVAHAICDGLAPVMVPLIGLAGSVHEVIYRERGHPFIAEFYADLDYADDGKPIYSRLPLACDAAAAATRVARMIQEGSVRTVGGKDIPIVASTICVHSDGTNALATLKAVRQVLNASPTSTA